MADVSFEKEEIKTIVLVGLSQHGKSSLASFLKEGKEWTTPAFEVGDGISSKTMKPKFVDIPYEYVYLDPSKPKRNTKKEDLEKMTLKKNVTIRVLDTPGIGDTREDQEQHNMLQLYNFLTEMSQANEHIACIALVVKFPTLIGPEFKENLDFYKRLFEGVFNSNLVLIITHVEQNEAWIKKVKKSRHPNETCELMRSLVTSAVRDDQSDIPTFVIDSACLADSPEELHAQEVRKLLFDRCCSEPSKPVSALHFPKVRQWEQEDDKLATALSGKKKGILKGIKLTKSAMQDSADKIAVLDTQLDSLKSSKNDQQTVLDQKDTLELFCIFSRTYSDTWHIFACASSDFSIPTKYAIKDKRVAHGYAVYDIETENLVKGQVYQGLWKNLSATLSLYTYNSIRFAEEIVAAKLQVSVIEAEINALELQKRELLNTNTTFAQELANYSKEVESITKGILTLKKNFMTLPEVHRRISGLNNNENPS